MIISEKITCVKKPNLLNENPKKKFGIQPNLKSFEGYMLTLNLALNVPFLIYETVFLTSRHSNTN